MLHRCSFEGFKWHVVKGEYSQNRMYDAPVSACNVTREHVQIDSCTCSPASPDSAGIPI